MNPHNPEPASPAVDPPNAWLCVVDRTISVGSETQCAAHLLAHEHCQPGIVVPATKDSAEALRVMVRLFGKWAGVREGRRKEVGGEEPDRVFEDEMPHPYPRAVDDPLFLTELNAGTDLRNDEWKGDRADR